MCLLQRTRSSSLAAKGPYVVLSRFRPGTLEAPSGARCHGCRACRACPSPGPPAPLCQLPCQACLCFRGLACPLPAAPRTYPEPNPDSTPRLVLTSDLDAGPRGPCRLLPSKPHTTAPAGFRHRHRPGGQPHPHPAPLSLGHGSLPVSPGTRSPAPWTPPSSVPRPLPLSPQSPSDPVSRVRKNGAPCHGPPPLGFPVLHRGPEQHVACPVVPVGRHDLPEGAAPLPGGTRDRLKRVTPREAGLARGSRQTISQPDV